MQPNPVSPRTRSRARHPLALIVLLLAALACNLPFVSVDTGSAPPVAAPETGPSVSIRQPAPGQTLTVGEPFDLLVTAFDGAGVVRIDLYVDNTLLISQPAPDANGLSPLTLMYPLVAARPGDYVLLARAYNSKGESANSAVHYVSAEESLASTPGYAQYAVQEGETLESIAQKAGVSVDDLLKANPSIQNGQVAAGQVILIPLGAKPPALAAVPAPGGGAQPVPQPVNRPGGGQAGGGGAGNPPGNQPPANPPTATPAANQPPANPPGNQPPANPPTATPAANQPPANPPGNQPPANPPPNGQPGILPIFPPGPVILPPLPPGVIPIDPSLFPAAPVINPSNGISFAPYDVVAALNGCEVTLTWNDNASSETNYRIWRTDPGAPASKLIGSVAPDVTQYKDTLTRSGDYVYEIEYYRVEQPDPNTIKEIMERSIPLWVEVFPSAGCPDTNAKRVIFEPVFFAASDPGMKFGFLNVTIGNFSAIRVPRAQQTSIPTGMQWDAPDDRWVIPMANLDIVKAGDSLRVEIQGNGQGGTSSSDLIFLLGQVAASHSYESLAAADAKDQIWEVTNGSMTVRYKIWLEDWQWGGGMASDELPVPRDLLLIDSPDSRSLSWTVDAKNPPNHDGFIVYSTYSCPGLAQGIFANRVVSNTAIEFQPFEEPVGCTCSHQVSSFGAAGESKLSEPTAGCRTTAPEESVVVTFEQLKIKNASQPFDAAMTISANGGSLKSWHSWFPNAGIYGIEPFLFTSSKIPVNFAAGQSRSIQAGFSVGEYCSGQNAYGGQSLSWPDEARSFVLSSSDGNCEVTITIQKITPQAAPPAPPPANVPAGNPPAGGAPAPGGVGNGTAFFLNQTSHPISSLVIDGKEVIQDETQVILPGSSLDVTGLDAGSHLYLASNGIWSAGNREILLPLLPAKTFSAASVTIEDPTIEELLTAGGSSGAFTGTYWDNSSNMHVVSLCFYSNGSFNYYEDSLLVDSGAYSLVSRQPGYVAQFLIQGGANNSVGSYMYAGPMIGSLSVARDPNLSTLDYIRDSQCP